MSVFNVYMPLMFIIAETSQEEARHSDSGLRAAVLKDDKRPNLFVRMPC